MSMIGSRSKYYKKLQYNTDSTSHSRRVSSRVESRITKTWLESRLESSRESRVHSSDNAVVLDDEDLNDFFCHVEEKIIWLYVNETKTTFWNVCKQKRS